MSEDTYTNNKEISVIIPVYNHAGALRQALESLKAQTFQDFEVIVIDDGSEDGIDYAVHDYDEDLTLRFYGQENKGAPAARNRGLSYANGKFVIFWDADIVGEPELLEKMRDKLKANAEVDFVYSNFFIGKKLMKGQAFDMEALKKRNYIHSTTLIRNNFDLRWDEALKRFQDWDLWLTLSKNGKKGAFIDEALFTIVAKGTMSQWLPRFAYKSPWKHLPWFKRQVEKYEKAKEKIYRKHELGE